jgi:hypothetical protein
MNIHLVVVAAFATYPKGALIIAADLIEQVLSSEDRKCVVRISVTPQQEG